MPDLTYEESCWKRGVTEVVGIDEAGRGPLAGPVSAAAVILPKGFQHAILNDSKKLSEKKRELIYEELLANEQLRWGHSFADAEEIEEKNSLKTTHAAMARAVDDLGASTGCYCLIDGLAVPNFPYDSEGIVKGDSLSLSIAAASIIAKVKRDHLMLEYAKVYPEYGFERHKGYGTKLHLAALREHGPTKIHRRSFAPVAQLEWKF